MTANADSVSPIAYSDEVAVVLDAFKDATWVGVSNWLELAVAAVDALAKAGYLAHLNDGSGT